MSLTITDFKTPTQYPCEMLKGYDNAAGKEDLLASILTQCIETGDLYATITTKFTHPDMVSSGLLEETGERQYRLTKKSTGLLYGYYASNAPAPSTTQQAAAAVLAAQEARGLNQLHCRYCGSTDLAASDIWAFVCNVCDSFGPRKSSGYTGESRPAQDADLLRDAAPDLLEALECFMDARKTLLMGFYEAKDLEATWASKYPDAWDKCRLEAISCSGRMLGIAEHLADTALSKARGEAANV